MTPEQFIAKWQASTRGERAACQEHFIDLCHLLGEPTPNSDPDGASYAFEKGAAKASGGDGWADVWRAGCFAWEYKGKLKDLIAAHKQLLQYAGALGNPPLLVVSDIARIEVRTNWTNAVTETHVFLLEDLTDPLKRQALKWVMSDPGQLRPEKTRAALTEAAAAAFADLAQRLRGRGLAPQAVAHFVNRLVFCLFADAVALLPAGLFGQLLAAAKRRPARFAELAAELFQAMATKGGRIGFVELDWFNGGLFDDGAALPLDKDEIAILERCLTLDWAEIDPSIFGTLFERGLDPDKRSQLGAHYTDRDKIEKLIEPVIRRPLLAEWEAAKARIAVAQGKAKGKQRKAAVPPGTAELRGFLDRLRAFRVLDPACGSGNFLYLALQALKDLELRAMTEAEALGLQREFPQVGPEAVLGIEINPYAAELARVSVWIGEIQWMRRHGLSPRTDPLLRKLDTIECRDAILTPDGKVADWPKVDAIVGNPPFLGGGQMRSGLGDAYYERLRAAFGHQLAGTADLVTYWFELAAARIASGGASRVGLVATNSIRDQGSREVLRHVGERARLFDVWPDEPWTVEGAAVRVSLVCFASPDDPAVNLLRVNGDQVDRIGADLKSSASDITRAQRLTENRNCAFQGSKKVGPFEVAGEIARKWLLEPSNPSGLTNAKILRPSWIGIDVARRPRDEWIIDFTGLSEAEARFFSSPFAHVTRHVLPLRAANSRLSRQQNWWLHGDIQPAMRRGISSISRYLVTPEVSKHRVFVWAAAAVLPDSKLMVIARDDDAAFGILQSRYHELWALAQASRHGAGNDPRYTPSTCFETFPFPAGLTPNIPASAYAADPRAENIAAAARALVDARDRWLNPPELVTVVPEVVPGFPDRILPKDAAAAAILKQRTLTKLYNTRGTPEGAWLDHLHRDLDAAVAAAYGWPADLSDDDVLARLLALNLERAN